MIKISLDYQPISTNDLWYGRRIKTQHYRNYERDLALMLPNKKKLSGNVKVEYNFYIPDNRRRDVSNFIKPLEDIIVKKGYLADDSQITEFTARKIKAKAWKIEVIITELP